MDETHYMFISQLEVVAQIKHELKYNKDSLIVFFEFPYDIAEPGGAGDWPENKGNSAEVCNIFGKKILKMEEIQSGGLLGRSHFICKFLSTHIALVPLKQIKRTENSLLVRQ